MENTQADNIARLESKVDQLTELVGKLVERNEKQSEMIDEAVPIAREVMDWATVRLDEAERAGWFALGREGVGILEAVVEAYEPEDVRALGESMVTILEAVRSFTQPEVMAMLAEAGEVITHGDELKPATPLDVVKAGRDPDVQRGLAVMVEVLRQVGHATKTMHPDHENEDDGGRARRKRIMQKRMAPSGGYRSSLGTRVPAGVQHAVSTGAVSTPTVASQGPAAASAPKGELLQIDGFELGTDGYLLDPDTWTRDFAERMAAALGVSQLTELHWKVLNYARGRYAETGSSPNIRAVTSGAGVSTKEIYALWPKSPGASTARVAGLPKPVGCI